MNIARRSMLGIASTALAACSRTQGQYFGDTQAPRTSRLVYVLGGEIDTLDPPLSLGGFEFYVIPALFEGLTQQHPERSEPMAGLATHYRVNEDFTRFTFYMRGHPSPEGIRLPSTSDLRAEFSRGRPDVPNSAPAYWSDGSRITAHDFVYSWRRIADPKTASPHAALCFFIKNAEEINLGARNPQELGVQALDDYTFQVDLLSPCAFFLGHINAYMFAAVPRQAIEAARKRGVGSSWTSPDHIVTSGAYRLLERRPYERTVAVRNPTYYDSARAGIEELIFITVVDGTTAMNLYRSGDVAATPGWGLPPLFTSVLEDKKDFHIAPAFSTIFPAISIRKPPCDNILVRYALNMATDKDEFTRFLAGGVRTARTLVPPLEGYPELKGLPVDIDGRIYDVLAFNVAGARALLTKAGVLPEVDYHFPGLPDARAKAEILQQQWKHNLGITVRAVPRELNVHQRMVAAADYTGVADFAYGPQQVDPNPFLEMFKVASPNPSGWTDPDFVHRLNEANSTIDPLDRLSKLAGCERQLLSVMPFIPLYYDSWKYLQKPFIRGLASNLSDVRLFKYAWIDTDWRPS